MPESFDPGEKDPQSGRVKPGTAKNVERAGQSPAQAINATAVGCRRDDLHRRQARTRRECCMCLDEESGIAPLDSGGAGQEFPRKIGGRIIGISINPRSWAFARRPVSTGTASIS